MTLVEQYHNDHKAIHQRIAAAAKAHEARKRAERDAAQVAALEKYFPLPGPKRETWFSIIKEDHVLPDASVNSFSIDEIQRATCRHFDLMRVELVSNRKHYGVVIPRQIAMYLCRMYTRRSTVEIGRRFGHRDHTTVIHAVRAVQKRMIENWMIAFDIAHIEGLLA